MNRENSAAGGMCVIRLFLMVVFGAAALAGSAVLVLENEVLVLKILAGILIVPLFFLALLFAALVAHFLESPIPEPVQALEPHTAEPVETSQPVRSTEIKPSPDKPEPSALVCEARSLTVNSDMQRSEYWRRLKAEREARKAAEGKQA